MAHDDCWSPLVRSGWRVIVGAMVESDDQEKEHTNDHFALTNKEVEAGRTMEHI